MSYYSLRINNPKHLILFSVFILILAFIRLIMITFESAEKAEALKNQTEKLEKNTFKNSPQKDKEGKQQ